MKDKKINKNEDIDPIKVGNFLRELRKEKNISQEKLADNLFLTRQAISSWEVGKSLPDYDSALLVANFYNITIGELFAGKHLDNLEEKNKMFNIVMKFQMRKSQRIILLTSLAAIILLFIFLIYFFFNTYKAIKIYKVDYADDKNTIRGTITKSVNDLYINIEAGDIKDTLCLLYKDNELYCKTNSNSIIKKERLGYNELLNVSFDELINNLYIKVNEENIKLNIDKDYENNDLIFNGDDGMVEISLDNKKIDTNIPNQIVEKFKYFDDDSSYNLEYTIGNTKYNLNYNVYSKIFSIQESNLYFFRQFVFNNSVGKVESFEEFDKNRNIKKYNLINYPDMNSTDDLKQIYKYYEDKYLVKYIY